MSTEDLDRSPKQDSVWSGEKSSPLCVWLAALEAQADRGDAWMLISLLRSARRCYDHLLAGSEADTNYAAWSCMNLLRVRILLKYAVQSEANRRRVASDLFLALARTLPAQRQLADWLGRGGGEECDVFSQELNARIAQLGRLDSKPLSMPRMAEAVGLADEYRTVLRGTRELALATPLSVLSVEAEDQAREERYRLLLLGGGWIAEMLQDLTQLASTVLPLGGDLPTG